MLLRPLQRGWFETSTKQSVCALWLVFYAKQYFGTEEKLTFTSWLVLQTNSNELRVNFGVFISVITALSPFWYFTLPKKPVSSYPYFSVFKLNETISGEHFIETLESARVCFAVVITCCMVIDLSIIWLLNLCIIVYSVCFGIGFVALERRVPY